MPLRNLAWLLIVPALVALGLAISYSAPAPDKDYQRVRRLVDVLAEVDAHFYRPLSDEEKEKLVEDMINGGLHKLDPHSEYFNAEQLKRFESDSEGSYGGVGILLGIDPATKFLKVESLFPGTPAYEAGVVANDLIVKVGDRSTEGIAIPDARKLIAGEPGTRVTITTRRAGRNPADEEVTLTRARVEQHPVEGVRRRPDDPSQWEWFIDKAAGIGYVRILQFNELAAKELKAAVEQIEREGGKALVLDLRDDPGGLLTQAIEVANLFLPEGKPIVSTRGRDPGRTRDFKAEKGNEIFAPASTHPVAVLVNDGSASASEIVASALQDNGRAVVVGERSYGKGSVQKLLRLQFGDEKAAVKLTTETYWRPSGKNMDRKLAEKEGSNEWGVKPDVDVPATKDEKLRLAVEFEKRRWVAGKPAAVGPNPPLPPVPKGEDGKPVVDESKPFVDQQLQRAIEVLKNKLRGIGAVPRRPRGLPARVAA